MSGFKLRGRAPGYFRSAHSGEQWPGARSDDAGAQHLKSEISDIEILKRIIGFWNLKSEISQSEYLTALI